MRNFDKALHPKKRAFLAAYSRCGSISLAAKRAKVDRTSHYQWKASDPDYAKQFSETIEQAGDALEDMMHEEAMVSRNITAAIFLLKGLKPEKYRERQDTRHSGPSGEKLDFGDFLAAYRADRHPEPK